MLFMKMAILQLIDKPEWSGAAPDGETFTKKAEDTLIPDIISIVKNGREHQFIILDAKYYNIQLEHAKKLRGQPGIESITKQYLYQQAYHEFIKEHQFSSVGNYFLMPTENDEIVDKGKVSLPMMHALGLEDIQVRLLPAKLVFKYYLENAKLQFNKLNP